MMAELLHSDVAARTDAATSNLAKAAKFALSRSKIFDLRRLYVEADGEAVMLRGRVSSFYHKQLAQEVVRNAIGGGEVINAIRVVYHADRRDAELDRAS